MISYSILVCTYNQRELLSKILDSLRQQIKNPKLFEIIIADDGSTDGTSEFVKRLRYPIFLKYVRSESNLGRAQNRNRGFQKAMGEWVISVDGDMVPSRDFVDAHSKAWQEFHEGVFVGGFRMPPDWKIQPWQNYFLTRGRLPLERGVELPGRYFTSGNFSVRKNVFDKLSGFDISFDLWGGEDTDFGMRLEENEISIYNIPDAYCFHHDSGTLAEAVNRYFYYGQNGYPRLCAKYPKQVIFERGWLLGLPDSRPNSLRKIVSAILFPVHSGLPLAALKFVAQFKRGALMNDLLFDWLFYGYLARGYRKRRR
jgi:glycosyltransferase involved in cell wall biosynthesis